MPTMQTTCSECESRISLITNVSVEILDCPECDESYKVSECGAHPVLSQEKRHEKLREWDEEVLSD
jgi:hypothetical protein